MANPNYNVVIISTFKPFLPDFVTEQTNALKSWKNLRCKPTIVIVGDDYGVEEICTKENIINHKEVEKNAYGTPLVGDIFKQGWKYATDDDICIFLNGDIILTNSLCDGLDKFVADYPNYKTMNYLISAVRWDWLNFKKIDFENNSWEKEMLNGMQGQLSHPSAVDIFIHRKNTFRNIPISGIAKLSYDSWLMGYANKYFDVTINATNIIKIYHQFGLYYQNKNVCPRNAPLTKEMLDNRKHIDDNRIKDDVRKSLITDCRVTW
jgi:hypothetical protein